MAALASTGDRGLLQIIVATQSGMTTDQFAQAVTAWIATAQHPRFHRLYTQCVYEPMLELIAYLKRTALRSTSFQAAASR